MEVQITCDGAENTVKGISKRVITGLSAERTIARGRKVNLRLKI